MKRFLWPFLTIVTVLIVGTVGYLLIGKGQYTFIDSLYMVFITVATIGFGEVVDLSNNPAGRVFTMFIAAAGIGSLTYTLTSVTAYVVEGDINDTFRRRRMERKISGLRDHYIVCGIDQVGSQILSELRTTRRQSVSVDVNISDHNGWNMPDGMKDQLFVEGDATQDAVLQKAGIDHAKGLFACTGNDPLNIVICLTAKQLNPRLRVVARCNEVQNEGKMRKAGADSVISPGKISGLRMASEMMRQTVVSFLDIMMRDQNESLRIEEITAPASVIGKPISELNLKQYQRTLLLAIRTNTDWQYNPPDDYTIQSGDVLVVMTTAAGRLELEKYFIE